MNHFGSEEEKRGSDGRKGAKLSIVAVLSVFVLVAAVSTAAGGWYFKSAHPNYAPSGMPDFDQKQDSWRNSGSGQWSFCGPTAVANCFWWFDSKYANQSGTPGDGADAFPLVSNYNAPNPVWGSDDHDPSNVDDATTSPGPNGELVERLAWCMDTDGVRTANPHRGTNVTDMQNCIDQWLNNTGLNNTLYEHTAVAPTFEYIEEEVERSQDVILLLGFWNNSGGTWCRTGGHYVTVAGVNSTGQMIAFSDPFLDVANPAANPTEHNDAANVSHDNYTVGAMNIPQLGNVASITNYPATNPAVYQNFAGQNVPDELEPYQCPSKVPDVAVVEYAVIVSPMMPPKPFLIYGWVKYSNGTEVLNPKNMTITNLRTSENYMVETNESYSYYQVIITSSCNVSAYDVLNFSADDGVNSSEPYEVTVTPGDMTDGGLFEQNLTIVVQPPGKCGDVAPYPDCDGDVNMGDVGLLLNNVTFRGNPTYNLCNWWAGDVAPCPVCDGDVNMGDVGLLLNNVTFRGDPTYDLCCA